MSTFPRKSPSTSSLPAPLPPWYYRFLRLNLLVLPFLPELSLVGLLILTLLVICSHFRAVSQLWTSQLLLLISGGMVVSALLAINQAAAFLQLANFLPFFAFFIALGLILDRPWRLEQIATDLVLTAIPLNLIGIVEWTIKLLRKLPLWQGTTSQWLGWPPLIEPHRAISLFGHPNWYANYLVLVLGLGLGLVLNLGSGVGLLTIAQNPRVQNSKAQYRCRSPKLLFFATYLNLVGIFCSGSRNGVIAAVLQLLLFSCLLKNRKTILALSLGGLLLLLGGVFLIGIGGRELSLNIFTRDPRGGIWQIALELIGQHPWWGWGLGSFEMLYPPLHIDPDYPYIAHPHNVWLMLAVETGIPVMLALSGLVGYIVYRGVAVLRSQVDRGDRPPAPQDATHPETGLKASLSPGPLSPQDRGILAGYLLAFAGCLVFALSDVTFYEGRVNVLNWLVLAGIAHFALKRLPYKRFIP